MDRRRLNSYACVPEILRQNTYQEINNTTPNSPKDNKTALHDDKKKTPSKKNNSSITLLSTAGESNSKSSLSIVKPKFSLSTLFSNRIVNEEYNAEHRTVDYVDQAMLNEQQKLFFETMKILLTEYTENDSASDGGNGFHRGVVLKGRGGTGKSTAINAIRSDPSIIRPGEEITTATTGKAAMLVNGSTIYSAKMGLKLPVGRQKFTKLNGRVLQHLQLLFQNVKVLFIDEYSMLPQKALYWIDQRLRQIKCCPSRVFGGVVVVVIGDLSQLPPVKAIPVWDNRIKVDGRAKDDASRYGMSIWQTHFRTVIKLEKNNRLNAADPDTIWCSEFLEALADGEVTIAQVHRVQALCSRQTIGDRAWRERGFLDPSTTYLFTTNKEVLKHNHKELQSLKKPILKVEAVNSSSKARAKKSDFFQQLENIVYLSIDAKVLLTKNLKPESGLANGSTGYVKAFVWDDTVTDEDISDATKMYVWVDFGDEYTGESFFPSNPDDRSGWFPIFSYQCNNHEPSSGGNTGYTMLSRAMLPLKLAWAWTIHKAQGQTIRGKIVLDLGKDERTVGSSYVAFSRATKLSNIGVSGGLPSTRLMEVLSRKKSLQRRKEADVVLDHFAEETKKLMSQNNHRNRNGGSFSAGFYDPNFNA